MSLEQSNTELSAPLQQLQDEHVLLRAAMNRFYEISEDLEYEAGPAVRDLFSQLHEQVAAFAKILKAHSRREEEALFPLVSRHLKADDRTIETMEFEHEKAEQHLRDFLEEADRAGAAIAEGDAKSAAISAVQAHATLTQHFAKEEKMLFPLAQSLLQPAEVEELARLLQTKQEGEA